MGTDIHLINQVYLKKRWQTIPSKISDNRCNITFKVLANIRNLDRECMCLPKGFPDDLEQEKFFTPHPDEELAVWLGDYGHSHFTLLELLETNVSFQETYLYEWINQLLELKKKYKVPLSGIRVIFGFDS